LVWVLAASTHDVPLIATIAVSLAFAFVGGLLAARLRLPPLVGYLLAGIVVGPFTPGFVADAKLAPQLAEIGVILLMFGVGTHFSIRDLVAVRGVGRCRGRSRKLWWRLRSAPEWQACGDGR
jgi:CPA2 family monovalent cation:H+ antiporter-2